MIMCKAKRWIIFFQVEIFSERSGGAYFRVSNVQLGQIGSNFDNTFNSSEVVIRYDATFDDGRVRFTYRKILMLFGRCETSVA